MKRIPCVLGIDAGTESVRAVLFDGQGYALGEGCAAYPTRFVRPGWVEQNPLEVWEALIIALREVGAAVPEADIAPPTCFPPFSVRSLSIGTDTDIAAAPFPAPYALSSNLKRGMNSTHRGVRMSSAPASWTSMGTTISGTSIIVPPKWGVLLGRVPCYNLAKE